MGLSWYLQGTIIAMYRLNTASLDTIHPLHTASVDTIHPLQFVAHILPQHSSKCLGYFWACKSYKTNGPGGNFAV